MWTIGITYPMPFFFFSTCMHILFNAISWTIARQAPLSVGSSRQEYWSGLPCSPAGDLSDPGNEPGSPALQVESLLPSHQGSLNIRRNHPKVVLSESQLFIIANSIPRQEAHRGSCFKAHFTSSLQSLLQISRKSLHVKQLSSN